VDVLSARVMVGWADSAADLARAEGLAGQALAESPHNPLAHMAKAQVLRAQRRYAEAIPEYETALASDRNADMIANGARDADAARRRQPFQPCGDIDAVSVNVAGVGDHVTEIDADAKKHAARRGGIQIPVGH
jgi:tetratricopeptide (TPR) repeat protein